MFKLSAVLTAFAAAASAASWPMITVNSAGEIVLNSVTKAQSIQLTPTTVTAAPTSGSATSSTVTGLSSDTDTFQVSIPSTIGTEAGFKLPAPTVGRTITLFNDGTGAGAFTVWTDATTTFFDSGSVYKYTVASTTSWVKFTATDTTNWAVTSAAGDAAKGASMSVDETSTNTAAATLTATQTVGGWYQFAGTTAAAITTPTGATIEAALSNPAVGDTFDFTLYASSTAGATLTAAASGVTVTAADAYVPAGARKTWTVYRSAASTFTFYLKSTQLYRTSSGLGKYVAVSSATTVTDQHDDIYLAVSATATVTLPSCTSANLGLTAKILVIFAGTATIQPTSSDVIVGGYLAAGSAVPTTANIDITTTGTANGAVSLVAAAAFGATANTAGAYMEIICASAGYWYSPYGVGNAKPTMT